MKRELIYIFIIGLLAGILIARKPDPAPRPAFAQNIGDAYLWQDSLATTVAAIDCTFDQRWEEVTIRTDSIAVWYRAGAGSDVTTSWASRDWMYLPEGVSLYFGTRTKLKRFEWKADLSETGVIFFEGIKTEPQY